MTYLTAKWNGQDVVVPWFSKELMEHYRENEPTKLVSIKLVGSGERKVVKIGDLTDIKEVDA